MPKKLMTVVKHRGSQSLTDGTNTYSIPDTQTGVAELDQFWLVEMQNGDVTALLLETSEEGVVVYEGDQLVQYTLGESMTVDDQQNVESEVREEIERSQRLQDLNQSATILRDVSAIGPYEYVLDSGNVIHTDSKIVQGNLVKTCPEYDLAYVLPVDRKILKQMVETNYPVSYSVEQGIVTLMDGHSIHINENDLIETFPDISVVATHAGDMEVTGVISSKYIKGNPEVHVGTHSGAYEIDPRNHKLITPVMSYNMPNTLVNKTSYNFGAVTYETFVQSVASYVDSVAEYYTWEDIEDTLLQEYTNFDGQPITLNVYDRLDILEALKVEQEASQTPTIRGI